MPSRSDKHPECASLTTSEWLKSRTFTSLIVTIISPISNPQCSAAVSKVVC